MKDAMMSGTIGAGGVWRNYKPQGTGVGLERAKEIKDYHKPRPDARETVKMSKMDGAELAAVSKKRMAKEHIQRFVETMSKPDITYAQWQTGVNNIWGVLKDNPTIKPEDIPWPKAPPKPPTPPKGEKKPHPAPSKPTPYKPRKDIANLTPAQVDAKIKEMATRQRTYGTTPAKAALFEDLQIFQIMLRKGWKPE